jgi:CubicO group peptidase (beta-lactamase class C family)
MRNLVCACTGVPRRDLELFFNNDSLTAEGIVESLQTFEFFTAFGEAFQYSNQLVATGGYAAAAAAGGEWGSLYNTYLVEMQQRILDPIGMAATTFDMAAVEAAGDFATPHGLMIDGNYAPVTLSTERYVIPVAPAGAPWSTAIDMARYLITELNHGIAPDGTRVVSAENLAVTWQPQVPVSAEASYGLGWFVDSYKGQPMIQHGGNTLGFTSDLAFLPEAGVGITVLTNARATNSFSQAVRFRLLEMIFQQPHEADTQAEFAATLLREEYAKAFADLVVADPTQVEPFLGRYTNDALGEIELRLDGDQLMIDAGEFAMELRAQVNEGGEVEIYLTTSMPLPGLGFQTRTGEDGQPTLVLGGGAIEYSFTPLE